MSRDNTSLKRRKFLAGAAALPLIGPQPLFAQDRSDTRLRSALRKHFEFSAGFREKLKTGYYRRNLGEVNDTELDGVIPALQARLARLDGRNLALIQHLDRENRMHTWLFGEQGLLAQSTTPRPYKGLSFLRNALRVDARMQTRSPRRKEANDTTRATALGNDSNFLEMFPGQDRQRRALARAADQLLSADVLRHLRTFRGRLLVLPVADSGTAPYAALPLREGVPLCSQIATVIIPDIQTLLNPRLVHDYERLDWSRSLVMGNPELSYDPEFEFPDLPWARDEASKIAELLRLDSDRFALGRDATLNRFLSAASRPTGPEFIHIASHAVSNEINPMDGSFVGLSEARLTGQMLRSDRFAPWSFLHPVVMLSGCQTALGKTFKGGTYGMSRVFFAAGAGQVVSSLWNVSDRATFELMVETVTRMRQGMPSEYALQQSQRKLASARPIDPASWASFNVYGLPGKRARMQPMGGFGSNP